MTQVTQPLRPLGRSRGLSRKGAMSRKDKLRLDNSRKRLRDMSSDEQSAKEEDTTTTSSGGDFPVIKSKQIDVIQSESNLVERKTSTSSMGFTPTPMDSDTSRARSPDSLESDSPPATVIHQRMETTSDSDHTIPIIGNPMMQLRNTPPLSQTPPSTDVEVSTRPEVPLPLERKRKPVPVPRRRGKEEEEKVEPFDEFKKIEVSSIHKMKSRSASPPDATTGDDIEFKKIGVTSPKQPDVKPMIIEPSPVTPQPSEKPVIPQRRPKLKEVEKQSSISSTISTTSSVMSEGLDRSDYVSDSMISQSSFDSVDFSESFYKTPPPTGPLPVRKEPIREVKEEEPVKPAKQDDQGFDWKRKNARRVTRRSRPLSEKSRPSPSSSVTTPSTPVEQEEDEAASPSFRTRSRALDKDQKRSRSGGMTRPNRFQRSCSPLTMELQQQQHPGQLSSALEVPGKNGSSVIRSSSLTAESRQAKSHPKSASFGAGPMEGEFVRTAPRRGRSQSPASLKPEGEH